MVSSTAMPRPMENTMAVVGFSGTPVQPQRPQDGEQRQDVGMSAMTTRRTERGGAQASPMNARAGQSCRRTAGSAC